jgi:hypothetical protein
MCRGPLHSSTLTVLHNWSLTRLRQGDVSGALQLLQEELLPAWAEAGVGLEGEARGASRFGAAQEELSRAVSFISSGEVLEAHGVLEHYLKDNSVANIIVVSV